MEISNKIPSFSFSDKNSEILKQSSKDAIQKLSTIGAFTLADLKNKLNASKPNYSFDTSYYDSNGRSSFLAGSEKIVSITFLPTQYINQFGQRDTTPRLDIHVCAVGVGVQNTIVKTELINQSGTIKEYISQPDYSVSVSGVLIGYFLKPTAQNPMQAKPLEDMKALIKITESKVSVKVVSDTLNLYGITHLSIDSLNMPQELSDINIQKFTMTCLSDNPELRIL